MSLPRALAACTPPTGSNTTVTCIGTTLDQGPGINTGYGDSTQDGLALTVVSGASVTGTSTGIDVNNNNTITNFGTITTAGNGAIGDVWGISANGPLTVINSGTIGRVDIPDNLIDLAGINANSGGLVVTNNNGGLIQGSIAIQGNVTATITNSGTISGIVGGGGQAINVAGGSVVITNNASGLITADAYAINADTANVTNYGTISAPAPGAGGTAINASTSATVTNYASGLITSDASAISAPTISVINFGTISGTGLGADGISGGLAVQVTNSGSITGGPGAAAISMSSGAITNNTGGTITGDQGIATFDATSIFNAGTITGTTGTAIQFVAGGNTLTLGPGFAINGNVLAAGADTFQLGGTGNGAFNLSTIGTQYTGFATFNVISGTWQATGSNGNNWTISGGNLQVGPDASPNASITGTVTLTGGTLSGLGTVGGIVNTAGNVMPGGSIGVLHVSGNYTQAAGGSLTIEVSPTAASQLKVGGAANLAGTLVLVFDPGIYHLTSYQILTASSVNGTFGNVIANDPLGITHSLLYDPTDVTLVLGAVAPTNDRVFTDMTSTLVFNGQQANSIILDRLGNRPSGIADGEVALGGVGPGLQFAQAGNATAIGDLASALPQALASQGAWFRGIGGFASVAAAAAAPGFTGTAGGFLAGFDRPVGENIYLGLAGGYLHSIVNENSISSGTADTGRLALYGGAFLGPSMLTATAGYARDWIDTSRSITGIGTAAESHGANEATAAAQWSLPLQVQGLGQGIATLTPKAGVQFLHLGESGFTETGAGGFDLAAPGHSTNSFQPFVEIAASQKFVTADGTLITPEVRLGYDREALSGARTLTVATVSGAFFPVTGIKPSRDMLTAGVGLAVQAGPALSLYATYDAVLPTGNTTDHTVQAGLRLKF